MHDRTAAVQTLFVTRLDTLTHLLTRASAAFADDAVLERRLAPDMHPLGTQVAFTCNQPHNFARWMAGEPPKDLDPVVTTFEQARTYIRDTRAALLATRLDDAALSAPYRLHLGPGVHADLQGAQYVDDFLIPNFYFHLVTAYAILRVAGLNLGKTDYMQHLLPFVRQA